MAGRAVNVTLRQALGDAASGDSTRWQAEWTMSPFVKLRVTLLNAQGDAAAGDSMRWQAERTMIAFLLKRFGRMFYSICFNFIFYFEREDIYTVKDLIVKYN